MVKRVVVSSLLLLAVAMTAAAQQPWEWKLILQGPKIVVSDRQGGYCANDGARIYHVSPTGETETLVPAAELEVLAGYHIAGTALAELDPYTLDCLGKDVAFTAPSPYFTKINGVSYYTRGVFKKKYGQKLTGLPVGVMTDLDGSKAVLYGVLVVQIDQDIDHLHMLASWGRSLVDQNGWTCWVKVVNDTLTTTLDKYQPSKQASGVTISSWGEGCNTRLYQYFPVRLSNGTDTSYRHALPDGTVTPFRPVAKFEQRGDGFACRDKGALRTTEDNWEYVPNDPNTLDLLRFPGDFRNITQYALTDDGRLAFIRNGQVFLQASGAPSATLIPLPKVATTVVRVKANQNVVKLTATNPLGVYLHYELVSTIPSLPVISKFSATPATIVAGDKAKLEWEVVYSTTNLLDQGIGPVAAKGEMVVTPLISTQYTLSAAGPGGLAVKQATVTVKPVPVILPEPEIIAVTNWYTGGGRNPQTEFAPGALVTVWGNNLGPAIPEGLQQAVRNYPKMLGNTTARLDCGSRGSGYVNWMYSSAQQLNVQLPMLSPGNTCQLFVTNANGKDSKPFTISLVAVKPNFQTQARGDGSEIPVLYHQDDSLVTADKPWLPNEEVYWPSTGMGGTSPWLSEGESGIAEVIGKIGIFFGGNPAALAEFRTVTDENSPGKFKTFIRRPTDPGFTTQAIGYNVDGGPAVNNYSIDLKPVQQ